MKAAVNQYGPEQAVEVFGLIREWNGIAAAVLDIPVAERKLHVSVSNIRTDLAGLFYPEDRTTVVELPKTITAKTLAAIPAVMVHEGVHDKRARFFPERYSDMFGYVIDEGVAVYMERHLMRDEKAIEPYILDSSTKEDGRAMDGMLAELMFFNRISLDKDMRVFKYILGNYVSKKRKYMRGYRLGHHIVASAAYHHGLSHEETIKQPDSFYREFAEEQL